MNRRPVPRLARADSPPRSRKSPSGKCRFPGIIDARPPDNSDGDPRLEGLRGRERERERARALNSSAPLSLVTASFTRRSQLRTRGWLFPSGAAPWVSIAVTSAGYVASLSSPLLTLPLPVPAKFRTRIQGDITVDRAGSSRRSSWPLPRLGNESLPVIPPPPSVGILPSRGSFDRLETFRVGAVPLERPICRVSV